MQGCWAILRRPHMVPLLLPEWGFLASALWWLMKKPLKKKPLQGWVQLCLYFLPIMRAEKPLYPNARDWATFKMKRKLLCALLYRAMCSQLLELQEKHGWRRVELLCGVRAHAGHEHTGVTFPETLRLRALLSSQNHSPSCLHFKEDQGSYPRAAHGVHGP